MKKIVDFMFNGIADKTLINDVTKFVCFSATPFVIGFISYTTISLGQNSIHCYFIFVFRFVIQIVQIQVATLLGMFQYIALTIDHICLPPFNSLLVFNWWF
jgi:hypothetical protein